MGLILLHSELHQRCALRFPAALVRTSRAHDDPRHRRAQHMSCLPSPLASSASRRDLSGENEGGIASFNSTFLFGLFSLPV